MRSKNITLDHEQIIEELRTEKYKDALWLSQRIMNLPVHQDVNSNQYGALIERLVEACEETR